MRLPFGLDLVSLIVGAVLVMFVWPWVMGMLARRNGNSA